MPEDAQPQNPPNASSSPFKKFNFSKKQLIIFGVVFGLLGVYILYKTFAAGPLVARVEGESMVMSDAAKATPEANATAGQAALIYGNGSISGQFTNSSDAVSLSVFARSDVCANEGGALLLSVDNQLIGGWKVNSATFQAYNLTKTIKAGTHSISINYSNDYNQGGCDRNLLVDRVDFFGPDNISNTKPTIAFGASPSSVSAGGKSTLIWGAKNATYCAASGAWSGLKATQSGQVVGPINSTSIYTITCSGPGGSATASATVTVTNASVNYFVGSYYDNADFTNLKFTKNDVFINYNWGNGSPRADVAADSFSVRWAGNFNFTAGTYDFRPTVDDGVRLYIDNVLLIDKWQNQAPTTYTVTRTLSAGVHNIRLDYYENTGGSSVNLSWGKHSNIVTPPPTSSTRPKLYGVNNFVGWGAYDQAKSQTGANADRVCQNETNMATAVLELAKRGMYFTVCVNDDYTPMKQVNVANYANLVASQARTYGPGGTFWQAGQPGAGLGKYAVESFELMNEPYGWWFRGGDNDPAAYAHLCAAAIRAGKAANPNAKFYVALNTGDVKLQNGTWVNWGQKVLDAEPSIFQLADGISLHLYDTPTMWVNNLNKWRDFMWSHGGNGKPIIITEGNLTDQSDQGEAAYNSAYPQFVQIVKDRPWVKEMFIFCWRGYPSRDYMGFYTQAGVYHPQRAAAYKNAVTAALQ